MRSGPASTKRLSPADFMVALLLALLTVSMLAGCGSNSPDGAVRKYFNAYQSGNWNAFKATVVPQNFTKDQDALAKSRFEQVKVKFQDIETETKYNKNDPNKASVIMTSGKETYTASILGKPTTDTRDIKKLDVVDRTLMTVRTNGVWLVDTKL